MILFSKKYSLLQTLGNKRGYFLRKRYFLFRRRKFYFCFVLFPVFWWGTAASIYLIALVEKLAHWITTLTFKTSIPNSWKIFSENIEEMSKWNIEEILARYLRNSRELAHWITTLTFKTFQSIPHNSEKNWET